MPRVKALTAAERQRREIVAVLKAEMERKGETEKDAVVFFPEKGERTFKRRLKDPGKFTHEELCALFSHYEISDAQLCFIFGVPYHGSTRI